MSMVNNHRLINRLYRSLKLVFIAGLTVVLLSGHAVSSTDKLLHEVMTLLKSQNYVEAIERLGELEKTILNPEELNPFWGAAYLGRGHQLLSSGNFADARTLFQNGRQFRQDDVRLWQGEAVTWMKEGRRKKSTLQCCRSLCLIFPARTWCWWLMTSLD